MGPYFNWALGEESVIAAAVADVHAPRYLDLFREALSALFDQYGQPDLMLLVGDVVEKNAHEKLASVLELLEGLECPIFACFGNEEYEESREAYLSYSRVKWLDDESTVLELKGLRIGLVGSRGSLDRPTWWQRTHIPGIRALYRRRIKVIDGLLDKLKADVVVVMTHYAPTYRTLQGEKERIWPEMACRAFEAVIEARRPHLWLHGHAHRASVLEARIGDTLVVNVSLPARRAFYVVDLAKLAREARRPRGLEAFMT
ncbi:metallophosphoesterase [Candidatus Bathyarchaeota archaeon ex4484_135]|nr:MAG: metallophosphoesterase [Candidatus Bathyarchaeota archaeon ex4484_135]